MNTLVVGMLIGFWLLVVAPAVVAPWMADTRRRARPAPAARRFPPPAGAPAEDAARPAA